MAIPVISIPLDGSLAGRNLAGAITMSTVGPVRYGDGPTPNPEGEKINFYEPTPYQGDQGTIIFTNNGAGSVDWVPKVWRHGTYMAKIMPSASTQTWGCSNYLGVGMVKQGDTITVSSYVEAPAGMAMQIGFVESVAPFGDFATVWQSFTGTGSIQRVSMTRTIANATTNQFWWRIGPVASTSQPYYVDGHQAELGSSPTTLIPQLTSLFGAPKNDHEWLRGAHIGPSRRRASKDMAMIVEEATVNLARNPRAGTNLTSISATDSVITRVTESHPVYGTAVKVVTDASTTFENVDFSCDVSGGATTPRTFSGSVDTWLPAGETFTLTARVAANGPGFLFREVNRTVVGTGRWTRHIDLTFTTTNGDAILYGEILVARSSGSIRPATTYYATAAQLEEKGYSTTFAAGDKGAGYSWGGAAHNSASTRAETIAWHGPAIPHSPTEGALICKYNPDLHGDDAYGWVILSSANGAGSNPKIGFYRAPNGVLTLEARDNTGSIFVTFNLPGGHAGMTPGWHTSIIRWNSTSLNWIIDSEMVYAYYGAIAPMNWSPGYVNTASDAQSPNCRVAEVMTLNAYPSDAEVTALLALLAQGPDTDWDDFMPKLGGVAATIPAEPFALTATIPAEPLAISATIPEDLP